MDDDVVSADGWRLVVSAGLPRRPLPPHTERISVVAKSRWFPRHYACGHRGPRRFSLHVYGVELGPLRQRDLCPGCFIEHLRSYAIHCARCGLPIYPGSPVALYTDSQSMLSCATEQSEGVVLGCLRFDCCPSGEFFAGHWSEQGFVSAFDDEEPSS